MGNSIVAGTTLVPGSQGDNQTAPITFPFPITLYCATFDAAVVSTNGNIQFTGNTAYLGTSCPLPDPNLGESIFPYQGDLDTSGAGEGIFTLVEGVMPTRIFTIEWRTHYFGRAGTANFEVRFFEATPSRFEVIYGATADNGDSEESGVQQSATGPATSFSCNAATPPNPGPLPSGLKVLYSVQSSPLYSQLDSKGATATVSQDFETANDAFDSQGADDFVVPGGQTWNVQQVVVQGGYFSGSGPAFYFNVTFYSDAAGFPGGAVAGGTYTGLAYTNVPANTFTITLSTPLVLAPGTYWVSVQARMDFTFGEWRWMDRTVQSNSGAVWQNPGGGLGTPCSTWGRRGATCGMNPTEPDQTFQILGF